MNKLLKFLLSTMLVLIIASSATNVGYANTLSSSEANSSMESSNSEEKDSSVAESESTKESSADDSNAEQSETTLESSTKETSEADTSDEYDDFIEESKKVSVLASKEPIYSIVIHNLEIPEGKDVKKETNPDGSAVGNIITDSEGNSLKGIPGVKFILQRIELVEGKIPLGTRPDTFKISDGKNALTMETTSDANGIAKFKDLYAGFYLVIANQSELVTNPMEDTVIEVPQTNVTGDGLINEINVYPKSALVKEKVELPETLPGTSTKTSPIPQTDSEVSELNSVTLMVGAMFILMAIVCFVLSKREKKE